MSFEDGKVGETLFGCRQGEGREKGERLKDGAPSDGGPRCAYAERMLPAEREGGRPKTAPDTMLLWNFLMVTEVGRARSAGGASQEALLAAVGRIAVEFFEGVPEGGEDGGEVFGNGLAAAGEGDDEEADA